MYILCALWTNRIVNLHYSGGASTTQSKKRTGSKRGRRTDDDANDGGGDDDDDVAVADADEDEDEDEDDDDDDDEDKEIPTARFNKGQKAFLIDGDRQTWGSVCVEDGETSTITRCPKTGRGSPKISLSCGEVSR